MKAFLAKYKGYIIHSGAVAVLFLDPAVHAWAQAHAVYTAPVLLAWGYALHWATGK